MGAKVIIFGKILNSNFLKGFVHSALVQTLYQLNSGLAPCWICNDLVGKELSKSLSYPLTPPFCHLALGLAVSYNKPVIIVRQNIKLLLKRHCMLGDRGSYRRRR